MEVTKWLKPSVMRVTTYGDSTSAQALARVSAEQAWKRAMHRPAWQLYRGKSKHRPEVPTRPGKVHRLNQTVRGNGVEPLSRGVTW